jgi:hypothetical protein
MNSKKSLRRIGSIVLHRLVIRDLAVQNTTVIAKTVLIASHFSTVAIWTKTIMAKDDTCERAGLRVVMRFLAMLRAGRVLGLDSESLVAILAGFEL